MAARTRPPLSANRDRAARLLVGGIIGWHAGLVAAIVTGALLGGVLGAVSAMLGAAMTLVYYTVGQGVQVQFADAPPRTLRTASVWSYVVRVTVLGALLWAVIQWPSILALLNTGGLFAGIVLGVLGWLVGLVAMHRRLRIPVFDA